MRSASCHVALPTMVQLYTQASITMPSPDGGLYLIESCSHMKRKHQTMVPLGTMEIFPGRPLRSTYQTTRGSRFSSTNILWSRTRPRFQATLSILNGKSGILNDRTKIALAQAIHVSHQRPCKRMRRKCRGGKGREDRRTI